MKQLAISSNLLSLDLKSLAIKGDGKKIVPQGTDHTTSPPPQADFSGLLESLGIEQPLTPHRAADLQQANDRRLPAEDGSSPDTAAIVQKPLEGRAVFRNAAPNGFQPVAARREREQIAKFPEIGSASVESESAAAAPAGQDAFHPPMEVPSPASSDEDRDAVTEDQLDPVAAQIVPHAFPIQQATQAPPPVQLPSAAVFAPILKAALPSLKPRAEHAADSGAINESPEVKSKGVVPLQRSPDKTVTESRGLPREIIKDAANNGQSAERRQAAESGPAAAVTKVETSFAPSPAQQVFNEVAQAAAPTAPIGAPALPAKPATEVMKTLHLRLRPEHLGPVKIEMHLRGHQLELKVEVETAEAHAELSRDETSLREMLASAGYEIADALITLRVIAPDTAAQPRQDANFSAQEQVGQRQSDAREGQGHRQHEARRDEPMPREVNDALGGNMGVPVRGDAVFL